MHQYATPELINLVYRSNLGRRRNHCPVVASLNESYRRAVYNLLGDARRAYMTGKA